MCLSHGTNVSAGVAILFSAYFDVKNKIRENQIKNKIRERTSSDCES